MLIDIEINVENINNYSVSLNVEIIREINLQWNYLETEVLVNIS